MDDVVVDYVRAGLTPYMVEHLYRGAALRGCGVADYCREAGYDPRLVMALARRWNIRTDNTPRTLRAQA